MPKLLIGTYDSRADAERVRDALIAQGVPRHTIDIHGEQRRDPDEPLPEDRGLAGFIGRMFSGALGDAESIRKYEAHVGRGGVVLAVRQLPDRLLDEAHVIMSRAGEVDVHDGGAPSPRSSSGDQAGDADAMLAAPTAPEGSSLPNASTGWQTSRGASPSTIGEIGHDPARPQGLTADAAGLGTDADRGRVDPRTSAATESPADTGASGAPDAQGHRVADQNPGRDFAVPPKR